MSNLKVPPEDYAEISALFREKGVSQGEIAAKYGCCASRISQIISAHNSDSDSSDFPHGTHTGYIYGCKCRECTLAARRSRREAQRKHGLFQNRRRWLGDGE